MEPTVRKPKPKKLSIFAHIVKQALIAYPKDAHLHIVQFLDQRGISKEEQEEFKRAWSKVILSNHAFGKGDRSVEPTLFATELVEELYKGTEIRECLRNTLQLNTDALESLSDYKFESTFSPKDVQFYDSVVNVFQVTLNNIKTTNAALFALPPSYLHITMDDDEMDLRSMMSCQDGVEKFRLVTRKGEYRRLAYNPIDPFILFEHGYKTGKLIPKTESKSKQAQLPPYFSTDEFLGLNVKFDMSSGMRDTWTTWSFLPHFLSCKYFNIFPKPLDVIDFNNPPSQMFCFENPTMRPFLDYLHPLFTEALLDHPNVVAFWCEQLAVTARALHTCEGKYSAGLKLENLLITEEGFLLQHRVGFSELEDEETEHGNFDFFTPYIYRILGAALGTSRTEPYEIPEVSAFRVLGHALQNTDTVFQHLRNSEAIYHRDIQQQDEKLLSEKLPEEGMDMDEGVLLPGGDQEEDINDDYIDSVLHAASHAGATDENTAEHDFLYEQYPTFTLLAGSHLTFHLSCGNIFGTKVYEYMDVYGPVADQTIDYNAAYNVLHVVRKVEDIDSVNAVEDAPTVIADLAHEKGDSHQAFITVQSQKPCKCYLELSAAVVDPFDPTKIVKRFCTIRIVVIPDRPAKSLFVQEVMEYLELYYFLRIPSTIFSSTLFHKSRDLLKDGEHSNELLVESTRDWIIVKKILKDHNLLPAEFSSSK